MYNAIQIALIESGGVWLHMQAGRGKESYMSTGVGSLSRGKTKLSGPILGKGTQWSVE